MEKFIIITRRQKKLHGKFLRDLLMKQMLTHFGGKQRLQMAKFIGTTQ